MIILSGIVKLSSYLRRKAYDSLIHVSRSFGHVDEFEYEESHSSDRSCLQRSTNASIDPIIDQTTHSLTKDFHGFAFQHSSVAIKLSMFYFFTFLVLNVISFSFLFEKWPIIDSLYFAVVTFTTVGYGDLAPSTQGGRLFTALVGLYGIIILGIFLGIIGHTLGEMQKSAVKDIETQTSRRVMAMFSEPGDDETGLRAKPTTLYEERGIIRHDVLEVLKLEAPILVLIFLICLLIGWWEGWTFIDSLYFCVISFSSVGYGDLSPQSSAMRALLVFFLPLAVAVFGETLVRIANLYILRKYKIAEHKFLTRSITLCDLEIMDEDQNGEVSKEEFLKFMLLTLQKVDKDTLDEICGVFDGLDVRQKGRIGKEDLVAISRRQRKKALHQLERVTAETSLIENFKAFRSSRGLSGSDGCV